MLYILFFIITLVFIGIYWYTKKNILLPKNTDDLINKIKLEGTPELILGKIDFVTNGKVEICYEVIGENKEGTVLLLNGLSQTMLAYPNHFIQPFLDAGYQVIRMDNRGLGLSSWMKDWTKENDYDLEDMATDAIAVLDQLRIEKTHLIGFSMGGMISQSIAISYPERLLSLTSMMTAGYYHDPELVGLPPKFYRHMVLLTLAYGRNLSTIEHKMKINLAINRQLDGTGDYIFDDKEELQKAYYELTKRKGYNSKVEPQHSRAIYLSKSRYEGLKKMDVPTLVVHGTADPLVLFENAEKYAPMIPHTKTLFIKGLGHHLPKKHTPEITKTILEHWRSLSVEVKPQRLK